MGQKTPNEIKQEAENKMEAERIREEEYRRRKEEAEWREGQSERVKARIEGIEAGLRAKQPGAILAKEIREEEKKHREFIRLVNELENRTLPDHMRLKLLDAISALHQTPSTSPEPRKLVTGFDVHSRTPKDDRGARREVARKLSEQPQEGLYVAHEYKHLLTKAREENRNGSSR
jgi:hypothetical protein